MNRYKRLLCMVDLTKDFFFSYSYNVMRSYQKNVCNYETGHNLYEKMFVWNEFLTRGIRHHLRNTLWTVALVYGFFKQVRVVCFSDSSLLEEKFKTASVLFLLLFSSQQWSFTYVDHFYKSLII